MVIYIIKEDEELALFTGLKRRRKKGLVLAIHVCG